MSYYQKLVSHTHKIANFNHLAAISGWDQAAVMPSGGNEARSNAMAELSVLLHQLNTEPQLSDWFNNAEQETLNATEQASLREMKQRWQQANVLPQDLVQAKSLAGSKCEHAWRTQRKNNDWQGYAKNWQEVVNLSQQEAQIRAEALNIAGTSCTPYDAMLSLYEPGTTTQSLDVVFNNVKTWLPNLIDTVIEQQKQQSFIQPQGPFSTAKQKELGLKTMQLLQFDFTHGRLDESVHPFCGGVPTDVRITTRYDEADLMQALMGIVHETGHARYEQGLPKTLAGLPVGEARSMGIHESQSLFFEMQLGRSPEFIQHLSTMASQIFQAQNDAAFSPANFQKLYTRVEKSFIRVDADELTYPAHVILRYEIERDLMNRKIQYQDIPELWDQKMQSYLGISTKDNYQNGCMQDIHWTDGSFGYFPSYTLGAMYAAQFMTSMKKTVDISGAIQSNNLTPIFNWLEESIWSKGSLFATDDLVTKATGEVLNAEHFKQHLESRYLR